MKGVFIMKSLAIIIIATLIYYLLVSFIVKFANDRKLSKLNENNESEKFST